MTGEAWAAIIAAIVTAIGTVIAAKFDDIADLIRRPNRKIAGEWESESWRINNDPDQQSLRQPESKQIVSIIQRGSKIKAVMTQTELARTDHIPKKFVWKGKIVGDYLIYQCKASDSELFLVSSAILYIHPGGQEIYGYFVANGGKSDPIRTWVGYTELHKRN
jgi:hypothetical protein